MENRNEKVEIIQINISGEDKPGLTSSLTDILARYDATILDIGQANIHQTLSMGILFKTDSQRAGDIMKDLLFKAYEVGNLSFYDSTGQNDMALTKPYSERTAQEIDAEVKKLIDGAFQRSLETLEKHRAGLTQLAELLLEREVIFAEDLEKIFGKRKGEIRKELEVKIEEPLNSEPSAE